MNSTKSNLVLYRPRTVWLSMAVTSTIVIALVIETFASRGSKADLVASAWAIFVLACAYLLFIHPKVEIFDEGVCITNPLQRITVGWQNVDAIEARYTMSISVNGKSIYAWAAPAPGRYHARTIHPSEVKGMDIGFDGQIRPGESPRSDSGQASYIAILRRKAFQEGALVGCESSVEVNYIGASVAIGSLAFALLFYALNF
jgi:hypothetical protein